jgi:hypothetical protein
MESEETKTHHAEVNDFLNSLGLESHHMFINGFLADSNKEVIDAISEAMFEQTPYIQVQRMRTHCIRMCFPST